jgi:hypothetical protein
MSSCCKRLLAEAFDEWADATVEAAAAKAAAQAAQLRRQLLAAQIEAARLAADNARYARLIDDPNWGNINTTDQRPHVCVPAVWMAIPRLVTWLTNVYMFKGRL